MNKWFLIVVLLLAGVYGLALNSAPNRLDDSQVHSRADSIAEKMLLAINQDDYASFTADLDQSLKTVLTESEFHNYSAYIKSNYGTYESKVFVNAIKSQNSVIVLYGLKFLPGKAGYLELYFGQSDGLGPVISYEIRPPINR
ncbi:MAG: hypothetical protein ABRQ26_13285 [Syntrophomonadaceae bacterium]